MSNFTTVTDFASETSEDTLQTDPEISEPQTESPVLSPINPEGQATGTSEATEIDKDRFISDQGRLYLSSLFYETAMKRPHLAVYTLADKDKTINGVLFPSLYRLYLEEQDLTEFLFATKHLYSYHHWQQLLATSWFPEYVYRWRSDLNLKITGLALQAVLREAQSDSKNSFVANKILVDRLNSDELQKSSKRKPKENTRDNMDKILADLDRLTVSD